MTDQQSKSDESNKYIKLPHFHWRRCPKNEVLDEFTTFAETFLKLFIKHGSGKLYFVELLDLEFSLADILRNVSIQAGQKSVANKLKLPDRRDRSVHECESRYFNECIDEVIKLNPDLLEDSSDGSGEK